MSSLVGFKVLGEPAPQGSKTAYVRGGAAVLVEGTSKAGRDKHALWRAAVSEAALVARGGSQFSGPVTVHIEFFMPAPASDPHRTLHAKKPDIDKLARSVLDSLKVSGLIRDDSLVHSLHATKFYARDGHWVGAYIAVTDSTEAEKVLREESKKNLRNRAKGA